MGSVLTTGIQKFDAADALLETAAEFITKFTGIEVSTPI